MSRPVQASSINGVDISARLPAYRIGAGLRAEEVAARLGISRTAFYRMEKGEIVKIDTLEENAMTFNDIVQESKLATASAIVTGYMRSKRPF